VARSVLILTVRKIGNRILAKFETGNETSKSAIMFANVPDDLPRAERRLPWKRWE
jgi:hypothetical protein